MKKQYIQPQVEVTCLVSESMILSGSGMSPMNLINSATDDQW